MTSSYRDTLAWLQTRSDHGRGFVSDPFWGDEAARLGLRRMATLLDRLGRPDLRYPIIHVAGSKGKGSTSAFAASILAAAGHRVGVSMSPHLHSFRERIVVAGEMISEEAFASSLDRVADQVMRLERDNGELGGFTAFEVLTAMALDRFAAAACDVAVVEVGMGGSLDSTNVVTPAVSVITTLDYEHTAVLGNTLAEIAANKAGIIKAGRPVVVAEQVPEALGVIEAEANRNESPVFLAGRDWRIEGEWRRFDVSGRWGRWRELRTGITGDHQMANAALALAAVMAAGDIGPVSEEDVRAGMGAAMLPGRFEIAMVGGRTVILDGAHTPLAAASLAATVARVFPGKRAVVVLGLAGDKRVEEIADALAPVSSAIVATVSRSPRAAETKRISQAFQRYEADVRAAPSVAAGLEMALRLAGGEDLILVTGSFTVVAEAREALGLAVPDGDA